MLQVNYGNMLYQLCANLKWPKYGNLPRSKMWPTPIKFQSLNFVWNVYEGMALALALRDISQHRSISILSAMIFFKNHSEYPWSKLIWEIVAVMRTIADFLAGYQLECVRVYITQDGHKTYGIHECSTMHPMRNYIFKYSSKNRCFRRSINVNALRTLESSMLPWDSHPIISTLCFGIGSSCLTRFRLSDCLSPNSFCNICDKYRTK